MSRLCSLLIAIAMLGAVVPAAAASDPLEQRLAEAYRSELTSIRVDLDYTPATGQVRGRAVLGLRLRPGQTRAVFHFNPLRGVGPAGERRMIRSIRLDGRALDPDDDADLRVVRGRGSAEPAFELRRSLDPDRRHRLVVTWSGPAPEAPAGRYFATFDDTEGPDDETETPFPTISSPEVLVRHVLRLRVHSDEPYTVAGSGSVRRVPGRVPTWRIDTRVPVSSSTVFFAALPRAEFRTVRLHRHGVAVRILTDRPARVVRRAERTTRSTIDELVDELGPFPVPTLDIMLTGWGSGMEYYGATRTGIGSLRHELGHMYFGVTAVNRTWRDTWFDEAVTVWWEENGSPEPVEPDFASSLGRGRSAVEPGFDESAYGAGARVLSSVAQRLGGQEALLAFLADLHARRAFAPFTTEDVIDDLVARGLSRAELERWLLSP